MTIALSAPPPNDDGDDEPDPMAAWLLRQIITFPLHEQYAILRELASKRPTLFEDERHAWSTGSLRQCHADVCANGERFTVTPEVYGEWRRHQADLGLHPKVDHIKYLFGNWGTAIRAAGLKPVGDPLAISDLTRARCCSREDVVAALDQFAARTDGPLKLAEFIAHCRAQMDVWRPGEPRLPRSESPIARMGGWRRLLQDCGYGDRAVPNETVATTVWKYNEQDILGPLASIAAEAGCGPNGPVLSRRIYLTIRSERVRAAAAEGKVVRIPFDATIGNRFGSFSAALERLGLPTRWVSEQSTAGYNEEELVDALAEVIDDLGGAPTVEQYALRRATADVARRVPSVTVIKQGLGDGSWRRACARVMRLRHPNRGLGLECSDAYEDPEVESALLEGLRACGRGVTVRAYNAFRGRRLAEMEREDPLARMPSSSVIKRQLGDGSWIRAVAQTWPLIEKED